MTENEDATLVTPSETATDNGAAPGLAALRHDANDLPWPHRPWIMAALCAVAGIIFFLLVDDGDQSPLRQALGVFVAVATIAFVLTVELRRWQWSAIFAVGWGAIVAGVGFYTAQYNRNGEIAEFPFLAGIFAVLLAAPLFQAARDVGSRDLSYLRTHNHIWNDAVIGAASLAFTGISFLLMFLLASLFGLVGMDFLAQLMQEGEFNFALAGAAFGAAVGILRERDALVGTMQRLVMVVLSVLAPVLAVGLVIFLVSLPFTGLQPLWDSTKATTPILLFCAAGAFLLSNVVIGNGAEDRFENRILQKAALVLALCILPLAIIAAISMGLRIQQYGWTPSRIWGALVVVVALAYGASYLWAVIKGRKNWDDLARQWNLRGAIGLVCIALFLALPILDFGAISARDQLARLKSGAVPLHKFDWAAMAYDFGPKGWALVKTLSSDPNVEIAGAAKATLAAENRWDVPGNGRDGDQDDLPLSQRIVFASNVANEIERKNLTAAVMDKGICRFGPCEIKKIGVDTWLVSGVQYRPDNVGVATYERGPDGKMQPVEVGIETEMTLLERLISRNGRVDWRTDTIYTAERPSDKLMQEGNVRLGGATKADVQWRPDTRQQLYINGLPTNYYIESGQPVPQAPK